MGEIAEMMLDGTLCEGCGEFTGDAGGYPQRCHACGGSGDLDDHRMSMRRRQAPVNVEIGDKLLNTLRLAAFENAGGLYPGYQWEQAPAQFEKLRRRGLVERYLPHNPVHKDRAVITDKGRVLLAAKDAADKKLARQKRKAESAR